MRADVPAIASLLLEGFGHEYGGMLRQRAGRRFIERIHALPGRLSGMVVAVDALDEPIGVAGLRTQELRPRYDGAEEQAMFEELGIGSSILLDIRAALTEPPPYHPRGQEAYIYSVSVTQAWRGYGVGDSLLHFLHERAHQLGKVRVLLEVMENNEPARRLYVRHGYTILRRRRGLLAWIPFGAPSLLLMCKQI
jgi:ribosomal protein S18 acetylase RimI-like enzyme